MGQLEVEFKFSDKVVGSMVEEDNGDVTIRIESLSEKSFPNAPAIIKVEGRSKLSYAESFELIATILNMGRGEGGTRK